MPGTRRCSALASAWLAHAPCQPAGSRIPHANQPSPAPPPPATLCCVQSTDQELLNFGKASDDEMESDEEEEEGEEREAAGAGEAGARRSVLSAWC